MKKVLLFGALLLASKLFSQETEIKKISFFVKPETKKNFNVITKKENIHLEKMITTAKKNILKVYQQKISYKSPKNFNAGAGSFYCLPDFSEYYFNKQQEQGVEDKVVIHGKIKAGPIDLEFKQGHNISGFRNGRSSIIFIRDQGALLSLLVLPKRQAVLLTGCRSFASFEMKTITGSGVTHKK